MLTVVVAGGAFEPAPHLLAMLSEASLIVVADSGADALRDLGIVPNVAVGDFDSIDPETLALLEDSGCELIRFPAAKDASDTELAVEVALERGADPLFITGATGGERLDHLLANTMLLALPALRRCHARIVDAHHQVLLACAETEILGTVGDYVTLIPLKGRASGIDTEGLAYPLVDGSIELGSTLGLSNVLTQERALVRVRSGCLLVIHHFASIDSEFWQQGVKGAVNEPS